MLANQLPLALLVSVVEVCVPDVCGQTVRTVATFNNIGVELTFRSPPPAGAAVAMCVRKAEGNEPFRRAHSLVRIGPAR